MFVAYYVSLTIRTVDVFDAIAMAINVTVAVAVVNICVPDTPMLTKFFVAFL
jgi:hypothetical protein